MQTEDRIWELIARKLSGEASQEELRELDNLLRSHPELHIPVQAVNDLWPRKAPVNDAATAAAWERHRERMRQAGIPNMEHAAEEPFQLEAVRPRPWKRYAAWAAAAGIVLFSVTWLIRSKQGSPEAAAPSEVFVKYGNKTRVQLPDGTTVWLNAGSKLTYGRDFGSAGREVTLAGEGFFDVAKDPERPFTIRTSRMNIRVLGTRFNLRAYPNDQSSEAALLQGSIEVSLSSRPAERFLLKPNEKIVVRDEAATPATAQQKEREPIMAIRALQYQVADSSLAETSWMDNKLVFTDEPFTAVALKMERWYNIPIRFKDAETAQLRFTGSFEKESVEQALRALAITAPFQYSIEATEIIISRD